ncbi:hypothetical protein RAS1_20150 [Phycisphaerae bacterium RAS1]|nr:hypothetical protein RAS1_20150 [Phycisphaerae bacterium RAS1]
MHASSEPRSNAPSSESRLDAVAALLDTIRNQGRSRLFEHEVYAVIERAGGIDPPRHVFWSAHTDWPREAAAQLPGRKSVLKLVSPDVIHKTEADAVRIVSREAGDAQQEARRLIAEHERTARVEGVLLVEFVEGASPGFGHELFVGIRSTREFGPVIAAGLGGVDTEYLAQAMRPGLSAAKAVAGEISVDEFLSLFRRTAAYAILSGEARGHRRIVSDEELRRCFEAFLSLARRFCTESGSGEPRLAELEVNPFAFRDDRLVPLDGRGRLGSVARSSAPRPLARIPALLEPESIAVLGVSATSMNLGRVVLGNILACGFPRERLAVIKEGCDAIDGVACVAGLAKLTRPLDLLVVAAPAPQLPALIRETADSGRVRSAILIPGGAGETTGSEGLRAAVADAIRSARTRPEGGPVFLGPNCLGVRSEPGRYDTFFVPRHKLPAPDVTAARPVARVALLSQSGAFIITRLSNLEVLRPALAISVGNQADLTLSDFVHVLTPREDLDVIAVYAEGFCPLDGAAFIRAAAAATKAGKLVILYKAGRTQAGRSAAAGHTAAIAGDYDVCQAAAAEVGVLVVDTFKEFEQVLELAAAFHRVPVRGRRIGAVTNAGYEAVGMADTIRGPRYQVQMAPLSEGPRERLAEILAGLKLSHLVNPANPLDLTPMAGEDAYESCARVLLDCDEVDALVVCVVPLTPALKSTAAELADSAALPQRLPRLLREHRKPLVFVVDCGPLYDPLALAVRAAGIPVFRSSDQAIRSLGHYLDHRVSGA